MPRAFQIAEATTIFLKFFQKKFPVVPQRLDTSNYNHSKATARSNCVTMHLAGMETPKLNEPQNLSHYVHSSSSDSAQRQTSALGISPLPVDRSTQMLGLHSKTPGV